MKKFFALLKVSVKAMLLTSSGVGAGRRRRAASGVGAVLLIAFLGLYLSGMYSFMLVDVLAPVGMESLVLVFMGLVALLGGLLFTVFAVRGVLFGGRDNDLMLSLPVPASMLVASRMAAIYVENLVFSFFVLLPAGAACFFLGSQDYGLGLWLRCYWPLWPCPCWTRCCPWCWERRWPSCQRKCPGVRPSAKTWLWLYFSWRCSGSPSSSTG